MKRFSTIIKQLYRKAKLKIYFWLNKVLNQMTTKEIKTLFGISESENLNQYYYFFTNTIDNLHCLIHIKPIQALYAGIELRNENIELCNIYDFDDINLAENTSLLLTQYKSIAIRNLDIENGIPLSKICMFKLVNYGQ